MLVLGRGINGLIVTYPSSRFARYCLSSLWRETRGRVTREIMGKRCGKELNAAGHTSVGEELRQEMVDIVEKAQKRRMQSIRELKEEILDREGVVVGGDSRFGERAHVEEKQKADEEKKARFDGSSPLSMPKQGNYNKKVDLGRLSMPSQIGELQDLVVSLREFLRTYMSRAQTERERLIAETKRLNVLLSKGEANLASTQASYSAYMTKALEMKNKAVLASVKPATTGAPMPTKQYQPSISTAAAAVASHPKYATRTNRVGWQSRWGPEEDQRVATTRESSENQRVAAAGNPFVSSNTLVAYEVNPKYAIRTKRAGWQNRWGLEEEVRANAGGQQPTPSPLSGFSAGRLDAIDLLSIVAELSELKQEVAALKR